MLKKLLTTLCIFISLNTYAEIGKNFEKNFLDDLDPRVPNIEKILEHYDRQFIKATGESPFIGDGLFPPGTCYRNACPVWLEITLAQQKANLYIDGDMQSSWPISSGKRGYTTPSFDKNPNGRIYDSYTSSAYPGGDYQGLGNMPYAVFISGGYAIHGTLKSNWSQLGKPASHGCLRLHPDNAFIFNRLVRSLGVGSVWITIE
jgi:hypothetical protein